MTESPSQGPQDDTTDPRGESTASPNPDQVSNGSAEQKTRAARPRVFGRGGFFATVIPFAVFLVGVNLTAYREGVEDITHLNKKKEPLLHAITAVDRHFEVLENAGKKADADAWMAYLKWKEFKDAVKDADHEETPATTREAGKRLYGNRPGLNELDVFVNLRTEFEKYVNYWERYEAVAKGEEPPATSATDGGEGEEGIRYVRKYPRYYTLTIIPTTLLMLIAIPWYLKTPFNFSWLSVAVGVVGIFVWIGLYLLDKNLLHLGDLFPASRAAFDPFTELKDDPKWMWQFISIRFFGLVLIVPVIEEFFLRGWLMRYIDDPDWDEIPLGQAGKLALIGVPIYALLTHPTEPLAAVVWFSMVTWLFIRTKSIWNCVIAHAITNLLLGIYVMQTHTWELW